MSKKKAIICTILFAIVICAVFFSTFFIGKDSEIKLWAVITCCVTGNWIANCIMKFYDWLTK